MPQFDTVSFLNQVFSIIYGGIFFQWFTIYSVILVSKTLKFRKKLLNTFKKASINKKSPDIFSTFILIFLGKN